jgi:hypothetical protein
MPILSSRGGGAVKGFGLTSGGFGAPYDIDFLLIAGGGAGGNYLSYQSGCGGGGAGGYRTSYGTAPATGQSGGGGPAESLLSIRKGELLTITVGAGGSAVAAPAVVTKGNDSVIEGEALSAVTSLGGGRGYAQTNQGGDQTGMNGGSGGGGFATPFPSGSAGLGTANQGYDGGKITYGPANDYGCTGGGGAGGQGSNSSDLVGGPGTASSITGSSITRAGGGGGGGYNPPQGGGSGGSGGGGNGANSTPTNASSQSGTLNTGSGGGGGSGRGPSPGGPGSNGGSGVIIIRLPTASYSGVTTGSPTVTTSGADTILTYTGTGTLKA